MNRGNVGGLLGNAPGPPHIVGLPQPSLGPGVGDMVAQLGGMGGMPSNIIQSRDLLYRLIISQLFYDGYQQVAVTLSNIVHADPPCPPSDRYKYAGYPGRVSNSYLSEVFSCLSTFKPSNLPNIQPSNLSTFNL